MNPVKISFSTLSSHTEIPLKLFVLPKHQHRLIRIEYSVMGRVHVHAAVPDAKDAEAVLSADIYLIDPFSIPFCRDAYLVDAVSVGDGDIILDVIRTEPYGGPVGHLPFRKYDSVRAVSQQKFFLRGAGCSGNDLGCAKFLQKRGDLQGFQKRVADTDDADIKVPDSER